jgi:protein-S-isoprenylcysteine O-methyltransferase Ste14
MLELVIFSLGSLGLIYISHRALKEHHLYGFPRFFAFEAILGLVVLNGGDWFNQPYSFPQLVSWLLLLGSIYLAIYSFRVLRIYGVPNRSIQDAGQLGFEKTSHLVTVGPYRLIRHPLYTSLLFLTWGIALKQINLVSIMLSIIASLALFLTAVYEERENLSKFGDEYVNYMRQTKRFIPFVF